MRRRVRLLRLRATELRRIADDLNVEADALEGDLSDLPLLGGAALVEAAIDVLTAHPDGMHYVQLRAEIETRTQMRVRGEKPDMTLLANLVRDDRVESVGSRSGVYRLAACPG